MRVAAPAKHVPAHQGKHQLPTCRLHTCPSPSHTLTTCPLLLNSGTTAHVTADFLADPTNVACLQALAEASAGVMAGLLGDRAATVDALQG